MRNLFYVQFNNSETYWRPSDYYKIIDNEQEVNGFNPCVTSFRLTIIRA